MKVAEALELYRELNPDVKVSMTTFRMLKPHNVRHMSETDRRSCLCTVCCNLSLKSEALQKFLIREKCADEQLPISKHELSSSTLCNGDKPAAACLQRECRMCSTSKLNHLYKGILHQRKNTTIAWYKWKYVTVEKDGVMKRCISCIPQDTSFQDFLTEVMKDLETYPSHHFRAQWQADQLKKCIANLPENHAVFVMDYAENYSCRYQNEVQTAFWDQMQVTIHPVMVYYHKVIDDKKVLVKHSVIGISDDTKHDADGVHAFEARVLEVLAGAGLNFMRIHQFTDGCAAQYKGCKAFSDVSCNNKPITRNYFETSHGKSVCDGLGQLSRMPVSGWCYLAKW